MQTFLPYPLFSSSASCLDDKRLGKQRVEAMQILNALLKGGGWQNHPAVKMWKGYEHALCNYGMAICNEWIDRGFKDTVLQKIISIYEEFDLNIVPINDWFPWWLCDAEFHASHQSNLVRKNPEHYRKWFPNVPDDLPYVWPVR